MPGGEVLGDHPERLAAGEEGVQLLGELNQGDGENNRHNPRDVYFDRDVGTAVAEHGAAAPNNAS